MTRNLHITEKQFEKFESILKFKLEAPIIVVNDFEVIYDGKYVLNFECNPSSSEPFTLQFCLIGVIESGKKRYFAHNEKVPEQVEEEVAKILAELIFH